jgi:hypothetical protein
MTRPHRCRRDLAGALRERVEPEVVLLELRATAGVCRFETKAVHPLLRDARTANLCSGNIKPPGRMTERLQQPSGKP